MSKAQRFRVALLYAAMPVLGAAYALFEQPQWIEIKEKTPMANDGAELPVLSISSRFSFSSLRISLSRQDGTVGSHCTGFLWERGGTLYLITN